MKRGRKRHSQRPEREELVKLLNKHGPLSVSHLLNVTKVSVHNWINEYGITNKVVRTYK